MARCIIDVSHEAFVAYTFVRMWWPGRCYWAQH
jgi:hypothetical protein